MVIDPVWLLVLPLLFAMGWVMARYDRGQQGREFKHVPKDILNGVSAILADDLAKATDSLLTAARSAPDSVDLHRAVGNLYRRRGLIDRAIEVHEIALRNPSLTAEERNAFWLDLGRDFIVAGIFDRAQASLNELMGSRLEEDARRLLLQVAQRTRDWQAAIDQLSAIDYQHLNTSTEHPDQLMAHFYCELASQHLAVGNTQAANQALANAAPFAEKALQAGFSGPSQRLDGLKAQDAQQPANAALTCKRCGFRSHQAYWQCPGCHGWDCFTIER